MSKPERRALEEVLHHKNAATIYRAVQRYNLVVNKAQITDSLLSTASARTVASETDHGYLVEACAGRLSCQRRHESGAHNPMKGDTCIACLILWLVTFFNLDGAGSLVADFMIRIFFSI